MTNPNDLPGIYSMSVTPFTSDGDLDESALRAHLRFQAAAGVGVYLGSYGTGEGHLLRERDIDRLYEIGVEELKGKVPVYAAALGFSETDYVIHLAKRAAAIGVDAVQIHPPRPGTPMHVPTAEELQRFYDDVLNNISIPVHVTNQMVMVSQELPIDFIDKLVSTYDNIEAINSTHPNLPYLVRLQDAVGDRVRICSGHVGQLIAVLTLGGHGVLCYESNIAPRLTRSVVTAYRSGDYKHALEQFAQVLRLSEILAKYMNPRSIKAALKVLGLPGGELRRPYLPVSKAAEDDIAATLDRLNIRANEGI